MRFDAVLLASFGGPEGPDEVMPFLEQVTAGRNVPRERLEQVAEHYLALGGVSPINGQNRALLAALRAELARRQVDVPVLWGNRNAAPTFPQALADARSDGARGVVAITTSAYSSYSGCRQYRENLAAALEDAGLAGILDVRTIRPYGGRPEFAAAFVPGVVDALTDLLAQGHSPATIRVLFCTHSLPVSMAGTSGPAESERSGLRGYVAGHTVVAERVIAGVVDAGLPAPSWRLVFSSRSGPPHVPWLVPDVADALAEVADDDATAVVVVPIGFVSDHMEVVWDLDREAAAVARDLGLDFRRTPTPGTDPGFVSLLADLVVSALRDEDVDTGSAPGAPACCGEGCCPGPSVRAAVRAC
jgi:ferrochelatase